MKLQISYIARDRFYGKARRRLNPTITELIDAFEAIQVHSMMFEGLHIWMSDDEAYQNDELQIDDNWAFLFYPIAPGMDCRPSAYGPETQRRLLGNILDGVRTGIEHLLPIEADRKDLEVALQSWGHKYA